jgi:hypothetical protein
MTLPRLRAILDAYGADASRWPADERDAALRLLARSSEARRHRDAAAVLDDALDAAPTEVASPALASRVLGAAPRRRRVRIERLIVVAAPLAAAAGLILWLVRAPAPEAPSLSATEIAALGVYDTPTDALFASTGTDLVEEPPELGCSSGELGCIDLDPSEPDDDTSRRETPGRMRA